MFNPLLRVMGEAFTPVVLDLTEALEVVPVGMSHSTSVSAASGMTGASQITRMEGQKMFRNRVFI